MIAFLFYRVVSAAVLFKQTKDLKRFFYQLLDLELYRALYLNYKLNAPNPTNPQRWIQSLGMYTILSTVSNCSYCNFSFLFCYF